MKVARLRRSPQPRLSSPFGVGGTTPMPALDDLSDVDLTGLADGDSIVFDLGSGTWVPGAGTPSLALDDLTDVNAPSPGDGDALVFDLGSGMWIPVHIDEGVDVKESGTPVLSPAATLDFTTGITASNAGGGTAEVELDDAYVTALITATAPSLPPTVAWVTVTADAPNIVTTDGGVVWVPLTDVDGGVVLALVTIS